MAERKTKAAKTGVSQEVPETQVQDAVSQTGDSQTTNTAQAETSNTNGATDNSSSANGEKRVEKVKFTVKRSITSLENMEEIELAKEEEFEKVTNEQEALVRLGNSRDTLIEVINDGLMARAKQAAEDDNDGWRTVTDKGELNGPFTGEMADSKKVTAMVLQFAKFNGYSNVPKSDKQRTEKRRKIREAAEDLVKTMITGNPAMKAQFAFTPGQPVEVVETETAKAEGTAETAIQ